MRKQVVIINGSGGNGKDTLVRYVSEIIPTQNYSSIDLVKLAASTYFDWDGGKTEKDRKFLSDLKLLTTEYKDIPFKDLCGFYNDFTSDKINGEVLFFHVREPHEIARAVKEFNATTLFIKNPSVADIKSNMADANVENYNYDYFIYNEGSLDDLKEKARHFVDILDREYIKSCDGVVGLKCLDCKCGIDDDAGLYCGKERKDN